MQGKPLIPAPGGKLLVYAQHDTVSQATLISERLKNELDLAADKNWTIAIRTLAQQATSSGGLTEFIFQWLSTDRNFSYKRCFSSAKVC